MKAYQNLDFVGGYGVFFWEDNGLTFTRIYLKGSHLTLQLLSCHHYLGQRLLCSKVSSRQRSCC